MAAYNNCYSIIPTVTTPSPPQHTPDTLPLARAGGEEGPEDAGSQGVVGPLGRVGPWDSDIQLGPMSGEPAKRVPDERLI